MAQSTKTTIPQAGQLVRVRQRAGQVREVRSYGGKNQESLHLVEVDFIDQWEHPSSCSVIWEREVGAEIISRFSLPDVEANLPDSPDRLRALIDAVRWSAVARLSDDQSAGLRERWPLVSPWYASVKVEDYQLYPVLKALRMPRVSLLLADDVGLGKTIEAGLILTELLVRRRIRRILVLCPASLQTQWREEMRDKFHLDFKIIDHTETRRIHKSLGMDRNPWTVSPRLITSMDYLRNKDILSDFESGSERLKVAGGAALPWDLLIVDEAHNFSPSSFGSESQRTQMLRRLTRLFEHRLFLTATPHNGFTISFTGLLSLLDPVRFRQSAQLTEEDRGQIKRSLIRRLKPEIDEGKEIKRFTSREVEGLQVKLGPKEIALFEAMRAYRKAVCGFFRGEKRQERNLSRFLCALLTKRLLSSTRAFARTWWAHVEGYQDEATDISLAEHAAKRAEEDISDDDERSARDLDASRQGAAWLRKQGERFRDETQAVSNALEELGWSKEAARRPLGPESSPPTEDAKWDRLLAWLKKNLRKGKKSFKDGERLIIFTEYKDSLNYLLWRLEKEAKIAAPVVKQLTGGAGRLERDDLKSAFNDPHHPVKILVATDAASEGLNLQTNCRYVLHQDVPWNPMRLEQRNGRVDRHGQARPVFCFHFVAKTDADSWFLDRVVHKVHSVRDDLGSVGEVLDACVMEHFSREELGETVLFERVERAKTASQAKGDLAARDLGLTESNAVLERFRSTEAALGLNPSAAARLLTQALDLDRGALTPHPDKGFFRLTAIPASWERLVEESLRVSSRGGALPKLAFDPLCFEQEVEGRSVFRSREDAALIRLSHPIMRRALGSLRRRLWDRGGSRELSRWTIVRGGLPSDASALLLFSALLQASNQLREVVHQELEVYAFLLEDGRLEPLENPGKWLEASTVRLANGEVETWREEVADDWDDIAEQLESVLARRRDRANEDFSSLAKTLAKREREIQRKAYDHQIKALRSSNSDRQRRRLRSKIEKVEEGLKTAYLFEEQQLEEERRLRELEWDLQKTHTEQLIAALEDERRRVLEEVIPRRFSLNEATLQPVGIEIRVPDSEV